MTVGPGAKVERGAKLDDGSIVGKFTRIGTGAILGERTDTGSWSNIRDFEEVRPYTTLPDYAGHPVAMEHGGDYNPVPQESIKKRP